MLLRCLNFNLDDSPEGMFAETVLAAGNELERHKNRRQVIQKQKARMDAGYWPFGGKKGYTRHIDPLHGKIFRPNEEGRIIGEVMEAFADRTLQRKVDVCRLLVERGVWKNQSPDKYIDVVAHMFADPFYVGDMEYPQWGVLRRKGQHEGIISLDTFDRIQKILKKEDTLRRIRQNISPDFPLRGLIVCDHCGSHLTAGWSKKVFAYYICHTKSCPRYGKSIRKEIIEGQFSELMQRTSLKTDIDVLVSAVFERVWEQEIVAFNMQETTKAQERKELEQKASLLTDAIFGSKSPQVKNVYEKQLEDVAERLEGLSVGSITNTDLSIPYRTALGKALGLLKSPYVVWSSLSVYEQQRLFFFIFEEKLSYNQQSGYRTEKSPNAIRLFEDFAGVNTQDVDILAENWNQLESYVFGAYEMIKGLNMANVSKGLSV